MNNVNSVKAATWSEEYEARFRHLTDREVVVWDEIISREIPNCTQEDLLRAVRFLGEQKRKGEFRYAPTVEDLISAIIHARHESQQSSEGFDPDDKCVYCRGGWLSYCLSIKDGTRRLGSELHRTQGWGLHSETTPCLCSKGWRALKRQYLESKHENMKAWAREVIKWLTSIPEDAPFDDAVYSVH